MKTKKLLFSVTKDDFEIQTFSVGGHGGGGKDTSNSGVRLVHKASGAVGEGREHRTNAQNRKSAFLKLVNNSKFKMWHALECARILNKPIPLTPEEIRAKVDADFDLAMMNGEILVEEY